MGYGSTELEQRQRAARRQGDLPRFPSVADIEEHLTYGLGAGVGFDAA